MLSPETNDLIPVMEAAHILGFKKRTKVDILIKDGILKVFPQEGSRRIYLSRKDVFNLPKVLPVPPSLELIHKQK